jgi:hypothetical protein
MMTPRMALFLSSYQRAVFESLSRYISSGSAITFSAIANAYRTKSPSTSRGPPNCSGKSTNMRSIVGWSRSDRSAALSKALTIGESNKRFMRCSRVSDLRSSGVARTAPCGDSYTSIRTFSGSVLPIATAPIRSLAVLTHVLLLECKIEVRGKQRRLALARGVRARRACQAPSMALRAGKTTYMTITYQIYYEEDGVAHSVGYGPEAADRTFTIEFPKPAPSATSTPVVQ